MALVFHKSPEAVGLHKTGQERQESGRKLIEKQRINRSGDRLRGGDGTKPITI